MRLSWPYRSDDFRADIAATMFGAAAMGTVAAIPLALLGLLNLVQQWRGDRPLPWVVYVLVLILVVSAYLLAAISVGTVVFLLRPLRKHWLGWVLTGTGGAICLYGSVLVAILVLWNPAGMWLVNIGESHPSRDPVPLMRLLPLVAAIFGPIGAVFGLYLYFTDDMSPRRRAAG